MRGGHGVLKAPQSWVDVGRSVGGIMLGYQRQSSGSLRAASINDEGLI